MRPLRLHRRGFLLAAGASLAAPALIGQGLPRVVVVGGGPAGATAAKALARDSDGTLDVTLIEPARLPQSTFLSNLTLDGQSLPEAQPAAYSNLAHSYGITIIHDWAVEVDREARTVALASGGAISYDRLLLAPGIDFVDGGLPGWDLTWQGAMPHAWRGGAQVALLARQIAEMETGGTFCLVTPPADARCPTAAYERVTLIALALAERDPTATVLLIDRNEEIPLRSTFEESWANVTRIRPDTLEFRPETMEVVIDEEVTPVNVCNPIPPQQAGRLAVQAELTDASGWVPVNPYNIQSLADAEVYVIGDAAAVGLPRTASSARGQALVAADVIRSELTGSFTTPQVIVDELWPLIAAGKALRLNRRFAPEDGTMREVGREQSARDVPPGTLEANFADSIIWHRKLIDGMLG